ncbi:MAG TPA: lantibiotic dehydratase [Cyclobacteriaceae bacterium]|nr:lantibiotic dehydratase [Cyclobacteriaceae bacterium]
MQHYQAQPKFLLRTPLLALTGPLKLLLSTVDPGEQIKILYQTYQNKYINDALFLASPTLHTQLEKRINGKPLPPAEEDQLVVSLTRYLLRMSTRCTPFGLFAGCTMGVWKKENNIRLSLPGYFIRHTRPDMDYLCQLAQNLSQLSGIKEFILYYPNNSHYVAGESIRFADYYYREKTRFHRLAAVERTDYLDRILQGAKNGAVLDDLVSLLTDDEVSCEEALDFLCELVDGKLLVSELDGNTTGTEMLDRMIAILRRLAHSPVSGEYASQLERLKIELEQIDKGLSNFDFSRQSWPTRRIPALTSTSACVSASPMASPAC